MLPPQGFLFPAMPIQNLREQPACLLFLNSCLFTQPGVGKAGTAVRFPGQRQRHGSKGADRRDALALQFGGVLAGDIRDEAEMIVGPASFIAPRLPAADIAMLLRLRIQAVGGLCIDDAFKGSARMPVKGRVIIHAKALRHSFFHKQRRTNSMRARAGV